MRKSLISSLMCVAVIVTSALGDTIHLKNGSVLKGKVTSFADDQFIVMLDTGSGRYLSKAMVYMGDVARIEFDTTQGAAADSGSTTAQPADPSARLSSDPQGRETKNRNIRLNDPAARNTQPAENQPRETGPPDVQPTAPPIREPETTQPERPVVTNPSPAATTPVS